MRLNDDEKTVAAMDVLVPKVWKTSASLYLFRAGLTTLTSKTVVNPSFEYMIQNKKLIFNLFRDEELGFECEHERLQPFDLSFEIGHLISEESDFFFPSLLFGSKPG
eukprot:jgi/Pico_ML_1/50697/g1859.t1